MKKTLIIANVLFASATAIGMMPNNDGVQQASSCGSVFDMNDIKREVKEIENIETKLRVEDYIEPSLEESSNSLCNAILQPDFEKVKRLVCKKADRTSILGLILAHSNYRKYNKKMPNAQFLKYHNLIFRSPDIKLVNFPYGDGETPLHTAAYDRNEDIVRCLINHGAEIDKPTDCGFTPLYAAIFGFISEGFSRYVLEGGTIEDIIEGVERGEIPRTNFFNLDVVDSMRECFIERDKCCNVIKVLLENGANTNVAIHDFTLLMLAWEGNFYDAMGSLIEYGADVKLIPLADVILKGCSVAFIEYLIDHGADVNKINANGESPLHAVMQTSYSELTTTYLVKTLLENGADVNQPNADGATPLQVAIQRSRPELATYLVKTLLENGADVNTEGYKGTTALMSASYLGREDIVRYLIDYGAEINKERKNSGITALWLAAQNGYENVVKVLAEHNANFDKINDDGVTPLLISTQGGYIDIVMLLTELGADVNKSDDYGTGPLWEASRIGNMTIVQYLIDHNAEIDAERNDGITPLWVAAQNGHEDVVKVLAENGADINRPRNTDGVTPLVIAVDKKQGSVVKYLLQRLMPEAVQQYGYENVVLSAIPKLMPEAVRHYGYENFIRRLLQMLRQQ